MRAAVLEARGIEQATLLGWTPRIAQGRLANGLASRSDTVVAERHAHWELLNTADVFIWLPCSWTTGEPEWISMRWRGRGVHFHWFEDPVAPPGHPIHTTVQQICERA